MLFPVFEDEELELLEDDDELLDPPPHPPQQAYVH